MTFALKNSKLILAFTISAYIIEHGALVDIYARLVVTLLRVHETHLAFATERSGIIEALPVFAQARIVGAFVDVVAGIPVASVSRIAFAFEGTVVVDALGVLVAPSVVGFAFVDVPAIFAISGEAVFAAALV